MAKGARPFRPANGTDGAMFEAEWCARCQCEPEDIEDAADSGCPILSKTFVLDVKDEGYPPEWVEDDDGPHCTAFIERTHPGTVDPYQVARDRERYNALPRDPKTGRPVIA